MSEDREILKGLDELLEGAGNRFGPMLLDELQDRLSVTVQKFDLELKGILEISFNTLLNCSFIINNKKYSFNTLNYN